MNTSAEHGILQSLPNDLRKNPERNAIQAFLKKKSRNSGRLAIVMISAFVIYCILLYIFETVHTSMPDLAILDNVLNLFPLALFPGLAIAFFVRRRMFSIPENEIDAVVEKLKSQHASA